MPLMGCKSLPADVLARGRIPRPHASQACTLKHEGREPLEHCSAAAAVIHAIEGSLAFHLQRAGPRLEAGVRWLQATVQTVTVARKVLMRLEPRHSFHCSSAQCVP